MSGDWSRSFKKAFKSGCYLAAHALVASVLIGII